MAARVYALVAVAVIAAVASMASVGDAPSQTEARPLQGVADGLVMSHQPAAPPYTDVGEYTTGSGARRGLLDLASALKKRLAWRETVSTVASSNLASTPTPDLAPWYADGGNGSVAQQQSRTEYVQGGGVNPPRALPPDDPIHQLGTTITIDPTPSPVQAATVRAASFGGSLTEAEMVAVLTEAGWPAELHAAALAVSWCESRWSPYAVGDGGRSLGLFQMQWSGAGWRGWFIPAGEDEAMAHDPVVNARTAWWAYQRSGWGPWSCAR